MTTKKPKELSKLLNINEFFYFGEPDDNPKHTAIERAAINVLGYEPYVVLPLYQSTFSDFLNFGTDIESDKDNMKPYNIKIIDEIVDYEDNSSRKSYMIMGKTNDLEGFLMDLYHDENKVNVSMMYGSMLYSEYKESDYK